jgi:hypothetical protein
MQACALTLLFDTLEQRRLRGVLLSSRRIRACENEPVSDEGSWGEMASSIETVASRGHTF